MQSFLLSLFFIYIRYRRILKWDFECRKDSNKPSQCYFNLGCRWYVSRFDYWTAFKRAFYSLTAWCCSHLSKEWYSQRLRQILHRQRFWIGVFSYSGFSIAFNTNSFAFGITELFLAFGSVESVAVSFHFNHHILNSHRKRFCRSRCKLHSAKSLQIQTIRIWHLDHLYWLFPNTLNMSSTKELPANW